MPTEAFSLGNGGEYRRKPSLLTIAGRGFSGKCL